jgi:pantothenate kinase
VINHRSAAPQYTPSRLALQNWHNQVALLEQWEKDEINDIYTVLNNLLHTHQSSAALAITRAALEIGQTLGE